MQDSREAVTSLLRPRYRSLLRVRGRKSYFLRAGRNLSLIVSFAVCLCAAAYMESMMDDLLAEPKYELDASTHDSESTKYLKMGTSKTRIPISVMKAVLENRGISALNLIERYELESAIQATGQLTVEELHLAQKLVVMDNQFNASIHSDALLYDEVLGKQIAQNDQSSQLPNSIVFDSESEFIERVDDNKDSVWLLVVVAKKEDHSKYTSVTSDEWGISSEIWAGLTHRYIPFGVKMGILNCNRLQSICLDRGLIAVDLVLALPRGGDRIKDSVQFRPFLLRRPQDVPASAQRPISDSHRQSAIISLIHEWITSVLSERVHSVRSAEDILPISLLLTGQPGSHVYRLRSQWSNWLTRSPQPIHFVWLRQPSSYELNYFNRVPLVLSALSVPYTGRIRFWTLDINESISDLDHDNASSKLQSASTSISSPLDLIRELACPYNVTYLVITPEGRCFPFAASSKHGRKEYLNFSLLELYLRFLYPSVDDLLLLLAFLVNLSVLLSSAITAGRLAVAAYLSMQHNTDNNSNEASTSDSTTLNNSVPSQLEQSSATDPVVSRLRMVQTLVNFARRGWTAYTPVSVRQRVSTEQQPIAPPIRSNDRYSLQLSRRYVALNLLRKWAETLAVDAFYSNLIILLTILPVINILSLSCSSFVINIFLWLFRLLSTSSPAVKLRLSISASAITWSTLLTLTLAFWCVVAIVSACYPLCYARHFTTTIHSRRRRRLSISTLLHGFNSGSPDAFWADLTRLLVVSDMENRTGYNSSTASTSSTDLDFPFPSHGRLIARDQYPDTASSASSLAQQATVNSPSSFDQLEQTRLLRRLDRLHQMLGQQGDLDNSTPVSAESNRIIGSISSETAEEPSVSSAHIYTWRCVCNLPCRNESFNHNPGGDEAHNCSTDCKHPVPPVINPLSDNDSDQNFQVDCVKPTTHRRRNTRVAQSTLCDHQPTYADGSGSDGDCADAEDEPDQPSDSSHTPAIKTNRLYRTRSRRQRRRPYSTRQPVPITVHTHDSSDPSSQEDEFEPQPRDGETENSDNQYSAIVGATSQTFAALFPNWPTWVIACHSCVVCRRTFRNGVRLGALPCGHAFHESCIRRWLDTGALDCPLCRWPAYAPHLRQQREMISQLISTVRSTLNGTGNRLTGSS